MCIRDRLSFDKLMQVFFAAHDPTTLNKQGHDTGTQYRSIILYADEEQKRIAETVIKSLNDSGEFPARIVTELKPLDVFYEAEDYHQEYYSNNPNQPYCQFVIDP